MDPIVFHAHMKAMSHVKYNVSGDLLFSTAREPEVMVWATGTDGQKPRRLGQYLGHMGAVDGCDVTYDSEKLATAGSDGYIRIWDVETGATIRSIETEEQYPARAVAFNHRMDRLLVVLKSAYGGLPKIVVYDLNDPVAPIYYQESSSNISCALWGPTSDTIYYSTDEKDPALVIYDTRRKLQSHEASAVHSAGIKKFAWLPDYSGLVTASQDMTAKLFEYGTLKELKHYRADEPLNTVAVHPTRPHVLFAGGVSAQAVTTTLAGAQRNLTRLHHLVYEDQIATVAGHFSPVNSVAFHPRGSGFVTAGEDGFIRLYNQFDKEYEELDDGGFNTA